MLGECVWEWSGDGESLGRLGAGAELDERSTAVGHRRVEGDECQGGQTEGCVRVAVCQVLAFCGPVPVRARSLIVSGKRPTDRLQLQRADGRSSACDVNIEHSLASVEPALRSLGEISEGLEQFV